MHSHTIATIYSRAKHTLTETNQDIFKRDTSANM